MIDAEPSLRAAEGLTGSALAQYLRSKGWAARSSRVPGVTILSKMLPEAEKPVQIVLPEVSGFSDEQRRVADALRTIEAVEERPMLAIVKDIRRDTRAKRGEIVSGDNSELRSRNDLVTDPLKVVALDENDIEVISNLVQDSTVNISDIIWRPQSRRLVLKVSRFDWGLVGDETTYRRRPAALRFDRALTCKVRNIDAQNKDAVLNLLAVEFNETTQPAGIVTLFFSAGAALRLEVE